MRNDNHNSNNRKQMINQRKALAKQAQKYHKEQQKKAKTDAENRHSITEVEPLSEKRANSSKIADAVNSRKNKRQPNLSREEQFRREGKERIKNLKPKDHSDGYYIDEFGEKKRQEKRAQIIKDQESEVIKKRKKPITAKRLRIRRILAYSLIGAVVIIVGMLLSLTVLFKTEKIIVDGNEYYYDEQIVQLADVKMQQNIFISALNSTPDRIVENLPYVEEARVCFTIPDTITIKLKNAVASYVIKTDSGFLIVSAKGRILNIAPENTDKLPEISCGELKSTQIGDYVSFSDDNVTDILEEISKSITENKIKKITGFDVSDTANITLNYDNRIKINIGMPDEIDYKIRTAITIINEKLDPNDTGTIKGTLDVSACNTTKMSHYKPDKTPSTTEPSSSEATSEPIDDNQDYLYGNDYDDNSATENYDGSSDYLDYYTYTDANQNYYDDGANGDNTGYDVYYDYGANEDNTDYDAYYDYGDE